MKDLKGRQRALSFVFTQRFLLHRLYIVHLLTLLVPPRAQAPPPAPWQAHHSSQQRAEQDLRFLHGFCGARSDLSDLAPTFALPTSGLHSRDSAQEVDLAVLDAVDRCTPELVSEEEVGPAGFVQTVGLAGNVSTHLCPSLVQAASLKGLQPQARLARFASVLNIASFLARYSADNERRKTSLSTLQAQW